MTAPERAFLARKVTYGKRMFALRCGHFSTKFDLLSIIICAALALSILVVAILALMTGTYQVTVEEVIGALTGHKTGLVRDVVMQWRLPRVAATIVFGAALGISGAIFQSLMRNPLASPDLLGFSSGSFTGALSVILVIGGSYLQVAAGALIGGMAAAILVYLLAWRRGVQGFRLIVVGIGISAMLGSINTWLILKAELDPAPHVGGGVGCWVVKRCVMGSSFGRWMCDRRTDGFGRDVESSHAPDGTWR